MCLYYEKKTANIYILARYVFEVCTTVQLNWTIKVYVNYLKKYCYKCTHVHCPYIFFLNILDANL